MGISGYNEANLEDGLLLQVLLPERWFSNVKKRSLCWIAELIW